MNPAPAGGGSTQGAVGDWQHVDIDLLRAGKQPVPAGAHLHGGLQAGAVHHGSSNRNSPACSAAAECSLMNTGVLKVMTKSLPYCGSRTLQRITCNSMVVANVGGKVGGKMVEQLMMVEVVRVVGWGGVG